MAITNQNQLIDVRAISAACDQMDIASEAFSKSGNKLNEASQVCTANALSVEQETLQPILEQLAMEIGSGTNYIKSITSNIRSAAIQIYNSQYQELEAYQQNLERQKNSNKGV